MFDVTGIGNEKKDLTAIHPSLPYLLIIDGPARKPGQYIPLTLAVCAKNNHWQQDKFDNNEKDIYNCDTYDNFLPWLRFQNNHNDK
jgi:hypothetical protein